ncbi:MAG: hemolysin family protein [Actinobacteria bacterium]|nr:hemolysin family protein [Actinomycetota bacterium]MBW3649366.1 hemolysin family protein [Actinomycetota bacterium]
MTGSDLVILAAVLGLILLAGFFALAETSLTRINRIKALTLEDEGRRGAKVLTRLVEHPERFLNPVLLLVLTCHVVASILVGILFKRFGAVGVALATLVEVSVIFVLAEAAPKTWAVQNSERAALLAAPVVAAIANFPPIRLLARALIGLANLILPGKGLSQGPFVSEEELLATVDVATDDQVIEREERALIRSIIEFGDTVAREVMVPRPDMVAVEGRDKVSDVLEVAISAGYSRIPVYDQGIDDITGIVYTKDLMKAVQDDQGDKPVRELVRSAQFVPETKRVSELMREMQREKFHIAIVVDEYGGTAGLVTLEDLIEELVGEIVDEFDVEEPAIEALPGGSYRVNARMAVDEVNELLGAEFPEGDWDTIGGFVFNLLGHVPAEGETVEHDGHRLAAEKVQGRRIGRVRITKVPQPVEG